jgi:DNA mismatch repair protein MSH6
VAELVNGSAALVMSEARGKLRKVGDIERLLSRVHSMGGAEADHPSNRQVLYEHKTHNKRKVQDFNKLLTGLSVVNSVVSSFDDVQVESALLKKVVKRAAGGGCFPDIADKIQWFRDNFDAKKAEEGTFEPAPGMDPEFDAACADAAAAVASLEELKQTYMNEVRGARGNFKYINTKPDQKDKYLFELPVSVQVPGSFIVKGKRGNGAKQICK